MSYVPELKLSFPWKKIQENIFVAFEIGVPQVRHFLSN